MVSAHLPFVFFYRHRYQSIFFQPPKKRSAPATPSAPKKARQSKLAKENDISAEEESEIKEVFHLFSTTAEEFPNEKEGVIAREDVRKALV